MKIKFIETGVELINCIKNQLLGSKYIKYQSLIKEDSNIFNFNKSNTKKSRKQIKSKIGLDSRKKRYFFMKILDKKCFLSKLFFHIPIFSCILCSSKVSNCDEYKMDKRTSSTLAIKDHHEGHRHLRFISPNNVSICKKSKISLETSFSSQSIQFLDDDIMDHVNYLTHPIYIFH
ncbi:Hypothetical protein SRAE_2000253900 [Strongyloides ratti]|uniref:Uncharacterized protein n=1 Tax=Strongyloides ratti TaxID=34506 RepID=A0A090LDN5_STRRB|nr:Hypothetical protein SRAE_2000253900 [Strongyloides ratti]CEF67877.1 Hypothetical protein SRAE_2000253900 [Strongyloides ratti]